jgi:3-hydroxyisobutyrate dehydrogenase-like beta-hydroxyacid dehydrogenase
MSRIGMIGVGAMGEPMAANLLKQGHVVRVMQSRRPGVADRLKALGAAVAPTPGETATGCEALLLALPTSHEVESVLFGAAGAAAAAMPGLLVIDCTTGNPPDTERIGTRLRQQEIALVAAGMTRGVAGAKQGKLAFFIGGGAADVEKAKSVLQATGDTFIQFKSASAAHAAKLVSNVLSYATVALVSEALMLGARNGVDLKTLYQALMEGAPSKALEAFGSRIVAAEYDPPRVTVDHACDDLVLAQGFAAGAALPVVMLDAAQQLYRASSARGHGARDISMIGAAWRSGVEP